MAAAIGALGQCPRPEPFREEYAAAASGVSCCSQVLLVQDHRQFTQCFVVVYVIVSLFHLLVGLTNVLPGTVYQWPCMCSVQRAFEASRSGSYVTGSMTVSNDPAVR